MTLPPRGATRRFRFAPTPSHHLHIGSALAALFGWGCARAAAGQFILRIEDIDSARCTPEFERSALDDLRWLGIDWDEGPERGGPHGPYRQSERLVDYDRALERLDRDGATYPCVCSRRSVREAAFGPALAAHRERPYPGRCRPITGLRAPLHLSSSGGYRLFLPSRGSDVRITTVDGALGPRCDDLRDTCGDFLIGAPGRPNYQLAVVVDDAAMGITDIVRGRDLIDSTARQIALHRRLGSTPPRFTHHPLVMGGDGVKLSKRHRATTLKNYRAQFKTPMTLIASLGAGINLWPASVRTASADDFTDALAAKPTTAWRDFVWTDAPQEAP